jgi:predicted ATP-grasp superfamily ATP-dependent carboligase
MNRPALNTPVLVCEYLSAFEGDDFSSDGSAGGSAGGGGFSEAVRQEGAAMLRALSEDLAVGGLRAAGLVHAAWKSQWMEKTPSAGSDHLRWLWTEDDDHARALVHSAVTGGWTILFIAPETDGTLGAMVELCQFLGGNVLNSDVAAIQLAGDKLALAAHLEQHRIPTIPTVPVAIAGSWEPPARTVIKPADGVGCLGIQVVEELTDEQRGRPNVIAQPFLVGRHASVAVITTVDETGASTAVAWPAASQKIVEQATNDPKVRELEYGGGSLPAEGFTPVERAALEGLALAACATIPGLLGYTGVDLLCPEGSDQPVVVEINPRLCMSYLGYRQLFGPAAALAVAGLWDDRAELVNPTDPSGWRVPQASW